MAYRTALLALTCALTLACDPAGPQGTSAGDQPDECVLTDEVRAGFTLDLGGWVAAGDDFKIDSACTVAAVASGLDLQCDDAGQQRAVKLTLAASHGLTPALQVGDSVALAVRREADAAPDRGFWTVRDADGALLLAGARSFSSVPGSDPEFFAPLTLVVDFKTCPEQKTDSCRLEQRVILAVADGSGDARLPQGSDVTLPSGLEMMVERAQLTMASSDAKTCPIDDSTPETYQFLVALPGA